ncbi:diguanylate cyclase [Salinimonas lutimaris]|uniref:diguanylate cyclase n=1 Tax=Salinimonas lutimaris TaxID=914153 RepID=UPI0010C09292|nr:diguanylate cyclase [Salinimonas lutimaris]
MAAFRTLHRSILLLFVVVVIAIVTLVHFSVSKIVAEQSRAQQQSISPAIALVVNELFKPLHVAEALGRSQELITLLDNDKLNKEDAFAMLDRLEHEFDLIFFVASEKSRMQYMSDGMIIPLVEGQVNWYFKYKELPEDAVADIGKWEDTHFYIDLKIYNEDGEFLGFFGVGKSLKDFVRIFNSYKQQYGYDFIFVDDKNDIMLSSDPALMAEYSDFTNLSELSWFASLPADVRSKRALNNRLITIDQQEYLALEVNLEQFNWTVFLLSPLDKRQTEISHGFIVSIVTLLVVVFAIFLMIYHLLYYFRRDMHPKLVMPAPFRLPEKAAVEADYVQLMKAYQSLSVMLVDIDNFTMINDTYGRATGDKVHQQITDYLSSALSTKDVLGRWSSEEFIILLPETGPHEAMEVAENLRKGIAALPPLENSTQLGVTASFGISYTATNRPMNEVASHAEDALYQARREGCNMVRMELVS